MSSNQSIAVPRATPSATRARASWFFTPWRLGLLLVGLGVGGAALALWPFSPRNLATAGEEAKTELRAHWNAGEVVVLVRHGERCDESSNPCLADADGITAIGRAESAQVGSAFRAMGLSNTDVLNSPLTRTAQTAAAMFAAASKVDPWLGDCHVQMAREIKARKAQGRNLVLVTHSGCIKHLEEDMGYGHARKAEYASSLFLTMGADGELKILGLIDPAGWNAVLQR